MVRRFKFIDDSLYTIAYNEIDTPKKREDVFYTLNLIRFLKPDMKTVADMINLYGIKCLLIFGKDDLLFPIKPAQFTIDSFNNVEVHEVPMGHWLVTAALDSYLIESRSKN